MTNIILRPETADDDAFLLHLYATTRNAEMAFLPWTEEQKHAFVMQQFQLQRYHYQHYYPHADFMLVSVNNCLVGRWYLHRSENHYLILDVSLLPEYRGQGIGSHLLQSLLSEAYTSLAVVQLHVEKSNPAQKLYLRLGFVVIEDKGIHLLMEWQPQNSAE